MSIKTHNATTSAPNLYYELCLNKKTRKKSKSPKTLQFLRENNTNERFTHLIRILETTLANLKTHQSKHPRKPPKNLLHTLRTRIIPHEYFGNVHNRNAFFSTVAKIITQSHQECVYLATLHSGWMLHKVAWYPHELCRQNNRNVLLKINVFMMERVVKGLLAFYYQPVPVGGNEIVFFPHDRWRSFIDQTLNRLLGEGYLSVHKCGDASAPVRGVLIFAPKSDRLCPRDVRPLLVIGEAARAEYSRETNRKLYRLADGILGGVKRGQMHEAWSTFVAATRDAHLYAAKVDLANAFSNVDLACLCDILSAAQTPFAHIVTRVRNQYVRMGGAVYKWCRGLLQGDPYSPALCEVYYAHLERTHLSALFASVGCFAQRHVDDYLYASTRASDVIEFVRTVQRMHGESGVRKEKTVLCLAGSTSERAVPFNGFVFDLDTRQVARFYEGRNKMAAMRTRMKALWNKKRQISAGAIDEFVRNALSLRSMSFFTRIELNTDYNTQRTAMKNFFKAMCYCAYKFDAAIMATKDCAVEQQNGDRSAKFARIMHALDGTVRRLVICAQRLMYRTRGRYFYVPVRRFHLFYVAYSAFRVVLQRRQSYYADVVARLGVLIEGARRCFRVVDARMEWTLTAYRGYTKMPAGFERIVMNRRKKLRVGS